jgi:hypothetical protein
MVSSDDLKKLENAINEDFGKLRLPVRIEIIKFSSTPTYALEHNLAYLKTVSKGEHLRVWEIVDEHYTKWLREIDIMST